MPKVPGVLSVWFRAFFVFGGFIAAAMAVPVTAQWKTPRAPGAVRREIDADAPAPRTPDGKPDLSGLWLPNGGDFSDLNFGAVPWTDEAEALKRARQARFGRDNPRSHCLPQGIVQQHRTGPVKFIQVPRELILLLEDNSERREIFTDGRVLPGPEVQPFWNGYSVGQWEDDTLVVTTAGFRGGQWLDATGAPLSEAATITERFRRLSLARMEVAITVDDRTMFLRSPRLLARYQLAPDDELIESVCQENNKFGPEPGTDRR